MTIKSREFDGLVSKLGLVVRDSKDLHAWFEHDGKIITRTRRSKGSGDLPMQHSIRQQLKLNEEQLAGILSCLIDRAGYLAILRQKGLV